MESIPLTVHTDSPVGLSKLRLKVSVNGEPAREFPLNQDTLAPQLHSGQVLSASKWLAKNKGEATGSCSRHVAA